MSWSIICRGGLSRALSAWALSAWAASAWTASAVGADAPDLAHGKALFEANGCYACHGRVGQGAAMTGPALHPLPMPLEAAMAYVRRPGGVMPPYSVAILSDANLQAILVYIDALPKTRPASDIPLLSGFVSARKNASPAP